MLLTIPDRSDIVAVCWQKWGTGPRRLPPTTAPYPRRGGAQALLPRCPELLIRRHRGLDRCRRLEPAVSLKELREKSVLGAIAGIPACATSTTAVKPNTKGFLENTKGFPKGCARGACTQLRLARKRSCRGTSSAPL